MKQTTNKGKMMKFYALFALLFISLPALSQTCYVDMVDRHHRVVRSFVAYGEPDVCQEGMKQCRKTIRLEPHLGGVDCIRANDQVRGPHPIPLPIPQPIPHPSPWPLPQPSPGHYPTQILSGETVYNVSNGRYAVVVAQDFSGKFVLRYTDNNATGSGWSRQDLAPLRGCDMELCVNDRIYNTSNGRYAVITGLQMGSKFVLKYLDNNATGAGWSRNDIAIMKGCDYDLCVGEQVYNVSNSRLAEIVALQANHRLVLKYKDNGASGHGWSRDDLAVMQGCQAGVCVGARVYNVRNQRYAVILALQSGNRFVLKYSDNGASGSGWTLSDLAPIR